MDEVWSERDTTPARIEAALRDIVTEHHHSDHPFVPARVLNVVVVVDGEYRGEIENRLERVGRYHPSRLVLCAVEEGRETIDAWAGVGTDDAEPSPGHIAVARERVELEIGPRHLRSSTRSSIRCSSPTWRRWCGRRTATSRRSTRCAGWRRSCWSTARTSRT